MIDRVILDKAIGIVSLIVVSTWIIYGAYTYISDIKKSLIKKGLRKTIIDFIRCIALVFLLIGIVLGIPTVIVYIILKLIE